jgi:hypothetical protein
LNSSKIAPIDKNKEIKISIKIIAADDMNVFIYKGKDRKQIYFDNYDDRKNDGKIPVDTSYEIDGSKGAMIVAYPKKDGSSKTGSINI